uniref:Ig-like domain-containing protein n=1 Tax=Anopheles culicifacies TaxID=139723 RepID=A0A182LUR1_9DIPT
MVDKACKIRQVSWFRRKDYQLLTVGLSTYSSDDRFLVEHTRHLGNWALRIKNARKEDEGLYECQISTHPPQSIFIELRIVEAVAEIIESPDLHIKEGSTLRLECKLKRATESPLYVFWYHEDRMVNYDQEDGVSVSNNKLASSILSVRNATARHGGNYTCAPANARQSSIYVHVLKVGERGKIDDVKGSKMEGPKDLGGRGAEHLHGESRPTKKKRKYTKPPPKSNYAERTHLSVFVSLCV